MTVRLLAGAAALIVIVAVGHSEAQVPDPPPEEAQQPEQIQREASITLAVSLQRGVTDQRSVSLTGGAFRRVPKGWSYALVGDYTFADVEIDTAFQTVADSQSVRFTAERPLTERTYLVVRPAFKRNEVQGVDYRFEELLGLGVHLYQHDRVQINVIGAGGGLQQEKNVPGADGGDFVAGGIQTSDWQISSTWQVSQVALFLRPLKDTEDYRMQGFGRTGTSASLLSRPRGACGRAMASAGRASSSQRCSRGLANAAP